MSDGLRFYNTMSRKLEAFESLELDHVRLYTCGPTVYDFAHIGNLRTFLFEDVLRRTLQLFGYRVTQVMNLTDVDDKTIRNSRAAGVSLREYTDRYVERLLRGSRDPPDRAGEHYPRATDYIDEMVELCKRLEDERPHLPVRRLDLLPDQRPFRPTASSRACASTRTSPARGSTPTSTTRRTPATSCSGRRPSQDEPAWQTELGTGRPGWHLECSAMSMALLGEQLRHPHRRRRQHLPAPRERDRTVGRGDRRARSRATGCTPSTWSSRARRWPSPRATSSPCATSSTAATTRCRSATC